MSLMLSELLYTWGGGTGAAVLSSKGKPQTEDYRATPPLLGYCLQQKKAPLIEGPVSEGRVFFKFH